MDLTQSGAARGYDAAAVAAREAEITGRPERIEALSPDAVTPDAWRIVDAIRAALGLPPTRDMAHYALVVLHHPELFRRQMEMGTTLFQGRLPVRERELAVLRIGWLLGAPYEWGEHVNVARRIGIAPAEIERVIQGSAAPGWSAHEAALLDAVEQMLARQVVSDETWAVLARSWDTAQLIEFPMMVGQYVCTAIVQNTLRVRLESGNPGLTHR